MEFPAAKQVQILLYILIKLCASCNASAEKQLLETVVRNLPEQDKCPELYTNLTLKPAAFSSGKIVKSLELKYIYEIEEEDVFHVGKAFHIVFSVSEDVPQECPLLFSIFQQRQIVPVILPYRFERNISDTTFFEAGRTLCTSSPEDSTGNARNITVHVTTCSDSFVTFNITAQLKTDLLLSNTSDFTNNLTAGPTTPQYLVYKFPKGDKRSSVRIIVESEDSICMIVSIQSLYCPIYEQETDVKYPSGLYKTMTKRSVLDVEQKEDFREGFSIVFVVKHDNKECLELNDPDSGLRSINNQYKNFSVRVEKNEDFIDVERVAAFFIPVLFSIFVTALITVGFCLHLKSLDKWAKVINDSENIGLVDEHSENTCYLNGQNGYARMSPEVLVFTTLTKSTVYLSDFNVRQRPSTNNGDVNSLSSSSIRTETGVHHSREKYNPNHFWSTLILVAIFYAIPVYELVTNFLITLNINGDYDYCFFNELCSHHLGPILDVNHCWSNVSYALLGLIFCLIAKCKGKFLKNLKLTATTGVAFQKDLFYGLGIALFMEGIFSGAYHLCPNKFTFQYDTTFMYVVSCLVLLLLFLSRHPIKHITASKMYTGLAILVIVTAVSYLVDISKDKGFKKIFCYVYLIGQTLTMLCISIYYCDVGLVKKNDDDLENAEISSVIIWKRIKYFFCCIFNRKSDFYLNYAEKYPFIWKRAITPFIAISFCIAIPSFLTEIDQGFASVLLFTIVTVTIISTSSYIISKCLHKEFYGRQKKVFIFPAICFILCTVFGAAAIYFFRKTSYDSDDSPAESRSKNQLCIFMKFYDAHDMWHMLSSMSLFIGYMGLLTMDDGLLKTPLENIHVF